MNQKAKESSLKMERNGVAYQVSLKVGAYPATGNLEAQLILLDKLGQETVIPLSIDAAQVCNQNCTIVNIGEEDGELLDWLDDNNVAYTTGRYSDAGFPELRFSRFTMPDLDPEGYAAYLEKFKSGKAARMHLPKVNGNKFPLCFGSCAGRDFNKRMLNRDARTSQYDFRVSLIYGGTGYYSCADDFVSDQVCSLNFEDIEDRYQDLDSCHENFGAGEECIQQLRAMWHTARDPFPEFLSLLGLTPSQLSNRFCIPPQTVEDWASGAEDIPGYVRLMMAEAVGVLDIRWYRHTAG